MCRLDSAQKIVTHAQICKLKKRDFFRCFRSDFLKQVKKIQSDIELIHFINQVSKIFRLSVF